MAQKPLQVTVRPMTLDDIDTVVALDRLAFPTPWSPRTYRHEILSNENSTMLVVEPGPNRDQNGNRGMLDWVSRITQPAQPKPELPLLAYSGFWQVVDEVHISTIAVHPDMRGRKLGELLIWMMMREAVRRGAVMVTLEVRISNTVAQNLYRKYGFEITGRRKGYYRDNGEDAHYMTSTPLDAAFRARLMDYGRDLAQHLQVMTRGLSAQQKA